MEFQSTVRAEEAKEKEVRCPLCSKKLLVKHGGEMVLRNKVTVFGEDGIAKAKCPQCRNMVEIPLRLVL